MRVLAALLMAAMMLGSCMPTNPAQRLTNPSPNYDQFATVFADLNASVKRKTGLRPYLSSRDLGDGIVEVTVNDLWVVDIDRLGGLAGDIDAIVATGVEWRATVHSFVSSLDSPHLSENDHLFLTGDVGLNHGSLMDSDNLSESNVYSVFALWSGIEDTGLPLAVYVVNKDGRQLMSISRGMVE